MVNGQLGEGGKGEFDLREADAGHAAYAGGGKWPAYNKVAESSGAGRAG